MQKKQNECKTRWETTKENWARYDSSLNYDDSGGRGGEKWMNFRYSRVKTDGSD